VREGRLGLGWLTKAKEGGSKQGTEEAAAAAAAAAAPAAEAKSALKD